MCSRIDPDLDTDDDAGALHAVEELVPDLAEGALQGLRVSGLHGRMSPEDKDEVMTAFAGGEIDAHRDAALEIRVFRIDQPLARMQQGKLDGIQRRMAASQAKLRQQRRARFARRLRHARALRDRYDIEPLAHQRRARRRIVRRRYRSALLAARGIDREIAIFSHPRRSAA